MTVTEALAVADSIGKASVEQPVNREHMVVALLTLRNAVNECRDILTDDLDDEAQLELISGVLE